jgi:hypothetical protein
MRFIERAKEWPKPNLQTEVLILSLLSDLEILVPLLGGVYKGAKK